MTNKRYTAVIIDDETKQRAVLRKKLEDKHPGIAVLAEADNADTGIVAIEDFNPQIVFLDIRMPRGSGFEMLNRLDKVEQEVIFITGYDQFALQALKLSAVDYLLKPLEDKELEIAIEKAVARIDGKMKISDYDLVVHNMRHQKDQRSKISLPGVDSSELIEVSEIIRFEGEQKYTRVYLQNASSILSSYNIGVFKEMLEEYSFAQCHKSHIVNLHHVKSYKNEGLVVMSNGDEVPVSRRRRDDFKSLVLKPLA